jgi:hypothetical protein
MTRPDHLPAPHSFTHGLFTHGLFTHGLDMDRQAVDAGLALPYSNGATESVNSHGRDRPYGRPPHRSRGAGLPHRAPTSGSGGEAHVWVGMSHPD